MLWLHDKNGSRNDASKSNSACPTAQTPLIWRYNLLLCCCPNPRSGSTETEPAQLRTAAAQWQKVTTFCTTITKVGQRYSVSAQNITLGSHAHNLMQPGSSVANSP